MINSIIKKVKKPQVMSSILRYPMLKFDENVLFIILFMNLVEPLHNCILRIKLTV